MKYNLSNTQKTSGHKDRAHLVARYKTMVAKLTYLLNKFESDPGSMKNQDDFLKLQIIKMKILRMTTGQFSVN